MQETAMISKYALQTQGILLALFAMLTFSINDGIFKYVMQSTPTELVVFTGYVFSTAFLMGYAFIRRISILPNRKRNGAIIGSLFLMEQMTFVFALKHLPIAELFVVILAAPVCVLALSSLILKEHLKKQEIFAVIFGFAGALMVVGAPLLFGQNLGTASADTEILAWGLTLLNVVFNSSKIIYLRKYCQTENPLSLSIFANVFIMVFFGIRASGIPFEMPYINAFLLLAGGILGGYGCTAYMRAFQLTKAPLVSATQYSQLFWTSLMGVFIFHEKLTLPGMIGIILIMTSGYFLYFKKRTNPN